MRLTFNMQFSQSLNGILNSQKKLSVAEQQLTRQTRILSPADDPAGSAKVLGLDENFTQLEQFQKNSILLKNNLALEETVLSGMRTTLDRVSTLVQASGNGSYGPQERASIAFELRNIQTELLDLMNTRSADGGFIFAGFQDRVAPYSFNSVSGRYEFSGDDGFKALQVSPSITLPGNDSGLAIFDNVFARFKPGPATVISGTPDSVTVNVTEQSRFDAFYLANYDSLDPTNNVFNIVLDASGNYEVLQNGSALVPPVTGPFTPGESFRFNGLKVDISGASAAPGQIDFVLPPPEKKNILNTLEDFIVALQDPNISSDDFAELISDTLVQVANSADSISAAMSNIGGRINVLDSVFENNEDLKINNRTYKADLSEVDFAAALTEIKRQEVALQALSSTFARISATTLFDFIR